MPLFEYKAIGIDGKTVKGHLESDAIKSARLKLKKQGLMVTDIFEKNAVPKAGKNQGFSLFANRLIR